MRQEMGLAGPMQHENGPMQLSCCEWRGQVDAAIESDSSFVTCSLLHKTIFVLVLAQNS